MFEISLNVNVDGLEDLTRKYPGASEEARVEKITEAAVMLEREIKLFAPYGAGPIHLRDSIHSRVMTSGDRVVGIVGTPLQHGEPVEKGSRPHFPPIGPIQHWVERKFLNAGEDSRSIAFLIARAISRRGTKGVKMFEKGLDRKRGLIIQILKEIPDAIARRLNV